MSLSLINQFNAVFIKNNNSIILICFKRTNPKMLTIVGYTKCGKVQPLRVIKDHFTLHPGPYEPCFWGFLL